jgi:glycosyltransferase involved in cell wall biosynthesis
MKVLHICLSSEGIGRYGLALTRGLKRNGVDVENLITDKVLKDNDSNSFENDATFIPTLGLKAKLRFILRVIRTGLKKEYNIIHDSAGETYMLGMFMWIPLVLFKTILVTVHDPKPHSGMGTTLKFKIQRNVIWTLTKFKNFSIAVHSEGIRNELISDGINADKIFYYKHGVLDIFSSQELDAKQYKFNKNILLFGMIRPNKGIGIVPAIARKLAVSHPEAKIFIAGRMGGAEVDDPNWKAESQKFLDEAKQCSNIELDLRFIPDSEVEEYFNKCGTTLLPYKDATQSGVLMIAMPLKSLIIATKKGGLKEAISHKETGLLCEYELDDIYEQINWSFTHPDETERIVNNAFQEATGAYSWDAIVKDVLLPIYQKIHHK